LTHAQRIMQLIQDGYLAVHPLGNVFVTQKGIDVLMSCADERIKRPPKVTKLDLTMELQRYPIVMRIGHA
jgi:hypothetical protein